MHDWAALIKDKSRLWRACDTGCPLLTPPENLQAGRMFGLRLCVVGFAVGGSAPSSHSDFKFPCQRLINIYVSVSLCPTNQASRSFRLYAHLPFRCSLIVFEDAAMICADCSALPDAQDAAQGHAGYHFATINGIVGAEVTYVARDLHLVCTEGISQSGRQSPQPSSRPSHHAPSKVPFAQWFSQAVCIPLNQILDHGISKKIIVTIGSSTDPWP